MPTCPACLSNTLTKKNLTNRISLHVCSTCGMFVSDITRTEIAEAEFGRVNAAAYHGSVGVVRQRQAQQVLAMVGRHRGTGKWLDVGCGFGYFLDESRRAGYDVFGVEPDETAYAQASRLLGANRVHRGLMTDAVRPDASSDVVSTLDVLEHIPVNELQCFARLIHRKLKTDGLWAIKLPSSEGLYFNVAHQALRFIPSVAAGAVARLWQSEYEFPHTVYFNRHALGLFLKNNGFEVVETQYIEEVPNDTILDRLLMDSTIPCWQARLFAPTFYLINAVEKLRGVTDALLVLARRRENSS